jgi:hypothetical protein
VKVKLGGGAMRAGQPRIAGEWNDATDRRLVTQADEIILRRRRTKSVRIAGRSARHPTPYRGEGSSTGGFGAGGMSGSGGGSGRGGSLMSGPGAGGGGSSAGGSVGSDVIVILVGCSRSVLGKLISDIGCKPDHSVVVAMMPPQGSVSERCAHDDKHKYDRHFPLLN